MDIQSEIFNTILDLYLNTAPWLVVGLVVAGVVRAFEPVNLSVKFCRGAGLASTMKATGLGTTFSFLRATRQTGPESVVLSYALLGPFLALVRLLAALLVAFVGGFLVTTLKTSVSSPTEIQPPEAQPPCDLNETGFASLTWFSRLWAGLQYSFVDILDDVALWLVMGLVLAGGLIMVVSPLPPVGGGLGVMVIMMGIGGLLFFGALASTPIAAGLLIIGVSPGAVLVFLLMTSAIHMPTLSFIGQAFGGRVLVGYGVGLAVSILVMGFATDAAFGFLNLDISAQTAIASQTMPYGIKVLTGLIFGPFLIRSLLKMMKKIL